MRWTFNVLWEGISSRSCLQLLTLYTLVCLAEGRPRTLKRCGRRDSQMGKIVGGKDAQPGEYPWQVSIQNAEGFTFYHMCGGTIINEHYIVTAAHCLEPDDELWSYAIYTGINQLSKKYAKPAKRYKISKMIVHEDYEHGRNDIALLRTVEPIQFEGTSGYVNGICLPQNDDYPTGWAIATGWGDIKEDGETSDVLKAVKVPLVSWAECFDAYEGDSINETSILKSHVCAGVVNRDTCQGDSGGPLVQKDRRGVYTLIGVVSFGVGCARREYPGVYTKVASYMDWLEENMD